MNLLPVFKFELHAYCLMTNHIHLLLRNSEIELWRFMERLQGCYARRFNRKYERIGHAFQGRFLGKIISNERYLNEVGRYIHMNPVKAKLVPRPEQYPWSSFDSYLKGDSAGLLSRGILLAPFMGENPIPAFSEFTMARHSVETDARGWPKEPGWYLPPEKVEKAEPTSMKPHNICLESEIIINEAARLFGCGVNHLLRGWRDSNLGEARALVMFVLREKTPLTLKDIASLMGVKTSHGVCSAIRRLHQKLSYDSQLSAILKQLGVEAPARPARP